MRTLSTCFGSQHLSPIVLGMYLVLQVALHFIDDQSSRHQIPTALSPSPPAPFDNSTHTSENPHFLTRSQRFPHHRFPVSRGSWGARLFEPVLIILVHT